MGKANRVKKELGDAVEMVYLIQTLKDIADNKYYNLIREKDTFRRFGESFTEFFRMISLQKESHPLISNSHPAVAIVVVTIEGSFLGRFNKNIVARALREHEKFEDTRFIAVGERSMDQLKHFSTDIKLFERMEQRGLYETAVEVKDYLVKEIMEGRLGRVIVCYSWPKNFETQRQRVVKLLPCDDLISKQTQWVNEFDNIIEESHPKEIIGYLSNLWITTRLYEIFTDTLIASAAAQAATLEDSTDRMKKLLKKEKLRFLKAKKSDIDKGLRETFTARMLTTK